MDNLRHVCWNGLQCCRYPCADHNGAAQVRGGPRGHSFAPGNPGKPKGARHKTTLAVDALLDGEAEKLTRAAVDLALAGDMVALRLCLDRIAPVRKDRLVTFALPPITTTADVVKASTALLAAVASGELTPSEAAELGKLVEAHVRAIEASEIEERLRRLEEQRA